MNVRNLSLHLDELLSTLQINFDVISVSVTWNSFENSIKTNVEIPGYNYFPYKSHSQNIGVALKRCSNHVGVDLASRLITGLLGYIFLL